MRALVLTAGAILLVSSGARAQTEPAAEAGESAELSPEERVARQHFELARELYANGDFDEAAVQFQAAYDASGRVALLYNIYLAHQSAMNLPEAATALEAYLEQESEVANRTQLEAKLAQIREALAEAEATGEEPELPSEEPVAAESGWPVSAWVLMGAGGALLVGGAVTGILSLGAQSDLESECPMRVCTDAGLESTRDRGRTLAIVTDVLLATGIVSVVVGVILGLTSGGDDEEPTVACGLGGCRMRLRF